eukprot:5565098-Karenia_brevis.AAC.1
MEGAQGRILASMYLPTIHRLQLHTHEAVQDLKVPSELLAAGYPETLKVSDLWDVAASLRRWLHGDV